MYEHVKTGCKNIPPSEQPLQFQSGYFLNKPCMTVAVLLAYYPLIKENTCTDDKKVLCIEYNQNTTQ